MAVALFLAMVLLVAAGHKAREPQRLATATARLSGAGPATAPLLLAMAGTTEVLAALALLLPATRVGGALAAAALWSLYGLALLRRRGERLDCGCDLVAREKPVTLAVALRPVALATLALGVALLPAPAFAADTPFAALALLALWFAAGELLSIPQAAWVRR